MPSQRERVDRGIYRVTDGVFELVVSAGRDPLTGKYKQVWKRHRGTLTSARTARRALLGKVEAGEYSTASATVDQLVDALLANMTAIGRSPRTIKDYRRDYDAHWKSAIGGRQVGKVAPRDIRAVVDGLTARGRAPSTVHHAHAVISAAFSFAMREEWITRDPTKVVQRPSKVNKRPVVPTPEEVRRLIETSERSDRPEMARAIWIAAVTGLRNNELRAVKLLDLDLEAGWLGIERAMSAEQEWTTKNRRIRDVGLDPVTAEVIRRQVAWMQDRAAADGGTLAPEAFLFSDEANGSTHWAEHIIIESFRSIADEAGCPHLTFRLLRKFMSTWGQQLGFSDVTVAMRAGHDPAVARKAYTGANADTDRSLSAGLAGLLTVDASAV